jgi:hypothetical protein
MRQHLVEQLDPRRLARRNRGLDESLAFEGQVDLDHKTALQAALAEQVTAARAARDRPVGLAGTKARELRSIARSRCRDHARRKSRPGTVGPVDHVTTEEQHASESPGS